MGRRFAGSWLAQPAGFALQLGEKCEQRGLFFKRDEPFNFRKARQDVFNQKCDGRCLGRNGFNLCFGGAGGGGDNIAHAAGAKPAHGGARMLFIDSDG